MARQHKGSTKGKSLTHKRYKDGNERDQSYTAATDISFQVRTLLGKVETPTKLPLESMRASLVSSGEASLVELFDKRVQELESVVTHEFDASLTHVAALTVRRETNQSRYLNHVAPCYTYMTMKEYANAYRRGGFRAANGERATLAMPLFLCSTHGTSLTNFFHFLFTSMVNVNNHGMKSRWHDLWVPDMLAHLVNQAVVDFAKGTVSEPAIQFVVDSLRLLVFCCQATNSNGLLFPMMVPLMKQFLCNFIFHPTQRTRDKVPDLGDLLQWLAALQLVDPCGSLEWKDMVHSIVVELFRRQARWVSRYIVGAYNLRPALVHHRCRRGATTATTRRRETRAEMVLRCVRKLGQEDLLDIWWEHSQVSFRVVLYSYAFYSRLVDGHDLESFKAKYDLVLGAVSKEDVSAIKDAEADILCCSNASEALAALGYPLPNQDIYRLCMWALEAQEGYDKTPHPDPLNGTWKETKPAADHRPLWQVGAHRQPVTKAAGGKSNRGLRAGSDSKNLFALLWDEGDETS